MNAWTSLRNWYYGEGSYADGEHLIETLRKHILRITDNDNRRNCLTAWVKIFYWYKAGGKRKVNSSDTMKHP